MFFFKTILTVRSFEITPCFELLFPLISLMSKPLTMAFCRFTRHTSIILLNHSLALEIKVCSRMMSDLKERCAQLCLEVSGKVLLTTRDFFKKTGKWGKGIKDALKVLIIFYWYNHDEDLLIFRTIEYITIYDVKLGSAFSSNYALDFLRYRINIFIWAFL